MANGDDAVLTRASVMFHTNDDDKDADSRVEVIVNLIDKTLVASIADEFQHFDDNSDAEAHPVVPGSPIYGMRMPWGDRLRQPQEGIE
jgi:hypothetical protein